jgi:hypothetical protein
MRHGKAVLALLIVIGVPATAKTLIRPAEKCFTADTAVYRFTVTNDRAMTVRVGNDVPTSDLSIRMTDSPELADLILNDDQDKSAACRSAEADRRAGRPRATSARRTTMADR